MSSLITAIRAAIRSGALPSDLEDVEAAADASASNTQPPLAGATTTGANMPDNQTVAGVASAATAAIAASAAGTDGFSTAMDRMTTILGADGIKGDGKRMAAALDLAKQSPDMAAEAVVSFVTTNVAAGTAASAGADAADYEKRRLAAAGLAQPSGIVSTPAAEAKAGWGKVSSKINGRIA